MLRDQGADRHRVVGKGRREDSEHLSVTASDDKA
jgi:hypothetical protein